VMKRTSLGWYRIGSVVVIVLAWGFFTLIRINGVNADLKADVSWRWTPSAEQRHLAELKHPTQTAETMNWPPTPQPGDWPSFRGPERDGVIRGITIGTDWKTTPPREVWRRSVGPAWSSVIIVNGRLFTQEQRGDKEAVVCHDARTGEPIWEHEDTARFKEKVSGAGPRATPTFAAGRLYTIGATGILNCLDPATGKRHWSRDIAADSGAKVPMWGFSSSPLVVDGLVVVFAGGGSDKNLLAYKVDNGAPAWTAPAGENSYSSPQLVTFAGKRQCLILGDHGLVSVDPATGAVLWKTGSVWTGAPRAVQPHVVGPTQLLVGTLENTGVTLLDVAQDGAGWKVEERWTSRELKPEFPDLVVHDGHAYGFDLSIFCCIDVAEGKLGWKGSRVGRGQVILLADQGLLLVVSESGELVLLAANPQREEVLGRFKALKAKTWSHPVIAGGRLYVRNAEEMVCYELGSR
jgi:outer membrane protein assembly factor BamB